MFLLLINYDFSRPSSDFCEILDVATTINSKAAKRLLALICDSFRNIHDVQLCLTGYYNCQQKILELDSASLFQCHREVNMKPHPSANYQK